MKWFHKNERTSNILEKIEAKYKIRRYLQLIIGVFLISIAFNIFL